MKKHTPKYALGLSALLWCFFTVSASAQAQNTAGVTDNEILIGSCSALEGPSHFLGTETVAGAKAYFALANDAGGVDGADHEAPARDRLTLEGPGDQAVLGIWGLRLTTVGHGRSSDGSN